MPTDGCKATAILKRIVIWMFVISARENRCGLWYAAETKYCRHRPLPICRRRVYISDAGIRLSCMPAGAEDFVFDRTNADRYPDDRDDQRGCATFSAKFLRHLTMPCSPPLALPVISVNFYFTCSNCKSDRKSTQNFSRFSLISGRFFILCVLFYFSSASSSLFNSSVPVRTNLPS